MAAKHLRGALVEYSGIFPGPFPNIVVFQFNPEQLSRTFNIAGGIGSEAGRERRQQETGATDAPPVETLTLTAVFSATDDVGDFGLLFPIARAFGVGPQLAALEKMVQPPKSGGLLGAAIDAVGALAAPGNGSAATRPIPREKVPRVLFIWGLTRVLPVRIQSLSITEQKFDQLLNPVEAQVQLGLALVSTPQDDDKIALGALQYSSTAKDAQAVVNLANAAKAIVDIIPF